MLDPWDTPVFVSCGFSRHVRPIRSSHVELPDSHRQVLEALAHRSPDIDHAIEINCTTMIDAIATA